MNLEYLQYPHVFTDTFPEAFRKNESSVLEGSRINSYWVSSQHFKDKIVA